MDDYYDYDGYWGDLYTPTYDDAFEQDWADVIGGNYTFDEIAAGDPSQGTGLGSIGTGTAIGNLVSNFGQSAVKALANSFKKPDGSVDWKSLATLGGGILAASGFGSSKQQPTGYQGKIPSYTAVRERVEAPVEEGRRPGSGGQRYFSDVRYAKPGEEAAARTAAKEEVAGLAALNKGEKMASGGIAALKGGRYLNGTTDGMGDKIAASIDNRQPAALSHGEFVIPADVVSHIGNGNSEAGAKKLYDMMAKIRKARTGTPKQGKQINPDKYMPA